MIFQQQGQDQPIHQILRSRIERLEGVDSKTIEVVKIIIMLDVEAINSKITLRTEAIMVAIAGLVVLEEVEVTAGLSVATLVVDQKVGIPEDVGKMLFNLGSLKLLMLMLTQITITITTILMNNTMRKISVTIMIISMRMMVRWRIGIRQHLGLVLTMTTTTFHQIHFQIVEFV